MSDPLLDIPRGVRKPRPRFGVIQAVPQKNVDVGDQPQSLTKTPVVFSVGDHVEYIGFMTQPLVDPIKPDAGYITEGPETVGFFAKMDPAAYSAMLSAGLKDSDKLVRVLFGNRISATDIWVSVKSLALIP